MSDSMDLSQNPLLEKIKPTADDQRVFTVLTGYVDLEDNDTIRLYERLDLRTYLEIPVSEIVWAEKLVPGMQASPTLLVINGTAQARRVTSAARKVEAGYLSGLIASQYLSSAAKAGSAAGGSKGDPDGGSACEGLAPFCAVPHGISTCHASGVCISDPIRHGPA